MSRSTRPMPDGGGTLPPPPTNLETMPGVAPKTSPLVFGTPEVQQPPPLVYGIQPVIPPTYSTQPVIPSTTPTQTPSGYVTGGGAIPNGSKSQSVIPTPGPSGGQSGSTASFTVHVSDRVSGFAIMGATFSMAATPFGYPFLGTTDSHGDCVIVVPNFNLPVILWGVSAPGYVGKNGSGQPPLYMNVPLDPLAPAPSAPAPTPSGYETGGGPVGTQPAAQPGGGFDWKVILPIIVMLLIVLGLAWAGTSKKKSHGGRKHRHSRHVSRKSR